MALDILPWQSSGIGPDGLPEMILDKGIVVLRDANCDRDDFVRFSGRIGTEFVSLEEGADRGRMGGGYSGRDTVAGVPSLFSVTGKGFSHGVPLHGELYFQEPDPPHLLWFYCQKPSSDGGETLFCDGEALFAALPRSIQQRLFGADLVYTRRLDPDVWSAHYGTADPAVAMARCQSLKTKASLNCDGSITTEFRSPAIRVRRGIPVFINNLLPFALREIHNPDQTRARVRLESGEPVPADEILEIERIAASLAEAIVWRAGDIAIVDNTRTLHGRNPILDSGREIYVRISNAGFVAEFLNGGDPL
jgi:alpha-ketoglutarate-dependent taurine dioxygenase